MGGREGGRGEGAGGGRWRQPSSLRAHAAGSKAGLPVGSRRKMRLEGGNVGGGQGGERVGMKVKGGKVVC